MKEICAFKKQPPTSTTISQILIDYLHIPLGSKSTLLPQPTQPLSAAPPPTWGTHYSSSFYFPYTPTQVTGYPHASPFHSTSSITLHFHLSSSSFHLPQQQPFLSGAPLTFNGPKHMKIELSRFFVDDLYNWLALTEEYMDYHEVDAVNRVIITGLYFTGDAAFWFKWYKLHIGSGLWTAFIESLLQWFEPGD